MNAQSPNEMLRVGGFLMLNKNMIKSIGLLESVLLSYLIDKYNIHGDWFYCKASYIYDELNIGRRPYDSALANLKNKGFVETRVEGLPAKVHFHINFDLITGIIGARKEE